MDSSTAQGFSPGFLAPGGQDNLSLTTEDNPMIKFLVTQFSVVPDARPSRRHRSRRRTSVLASIPPLTFNGSTFQAMGSEFEVEVDPRLTVAHLKAEIALQSRHPEFLPYILMCNDTQMKDPDSLQQLANSDGSLIGVSMCITMSDAQMATFERALSHQILPGAPGSHCLRCGYSVRQGTVDEGNRGMCTCREPLLLNGVLQRNPIVHAGQISMAIRTLSNIDLNRLAIRCSKHGYHGHITDVQIRCGNVWFSVGALLNISEVHNYIYQPSVGHAQDFFRTMRFSSDVLKSAIKDWVQSDEDFDIFKNSSNEGWTLLRKSVCDDVSDNSGDITSCLRSFLVLWGNFDFRPGKVPRAKHFVDVL